MQVEDLYKLLHQAAMGSEHAIPSRQAAHQWLLREIEALSDGPFDEPLVEPIDPQGRLVRVNLRPFLRNGGDAEDLLDAFVRTAEHHAGSAITLEGYCTRALELAREGALPFDVVEMEKTFARLKNEGYPAVHHSETYAAAYRPAYRVVLRSLLNEDSEALCVEGADPDETTRKGVVAPPPS